MLLLPTETQLLLVESAQNGFASTDVRAEWGVPERVTLLREMHRLAMEGSYSTAVRRVAVRVTKQAQTWWQHGVVLQRFVRQLRYTPDPPQLELLQGPLATLLAEGGDCDDLVITACALARSIGLRWSPAIFWMCSNPSAAHACVITEETDPPIALEMCQWTHVYGRTQTMVEWPPGAVMLIWLDGSQTLHEWFRAA